MVVDWGGSITLFGVGIWAASLLIGVIGHELAHFLSFLSFGHIPKVRFATKYLGIAFDPRGAPPRWQMALVSLAPIGWAAAGGVAFYYQLDFPLDWRAVVAQVLFFVGALPSPGDLYTVLMYHPDAALAEVAADG